MSRRKYNIKSHLKKPIKKNPKTMRIKKPLQNRRRLVTWQRNTFIFLEEIGTKSTQNQMKGHEMVMTGSRIVLAALVLL